MPTRGVHPHQREDTMPKPSSQRVQYQVRFLVEELKKITAAAAREGTPVSTWIRAKALQAAQGDLVPRK